MIRRLSIELTNRCSKGCWFCYNASGPAGATAWTVDELAAFVGECAAGGVEAVSLGGGEPLEFPGVFELLRQLKGRIFRSITTNGLPLDDGAIERLVDVAVDKVHVSVHFPDRPGEVERVVRQVTRLAEAGIRSGVNLLVARSKLPAATAAARRIRDAGIDNSRIVYLPMRG